MQEEISFGTWLRKQRRALDLTRQAFADEIGCAEVTLRRIESGSLKPSMELASILLDKLGVPQRDLPQWISYARGLSGFPTQAMSQPGRRITNLPPSLTSFVGRENELAKISQLLIESECRLLTVLGPGGIGKTRLAVQAMKILDSDAPFLFPDGLYFIPLVTLNETSDIVYAVAKAFNFTFYPGEKAPSEQLLNFLAEKKLLLVLDNFEHLTNAESVQWLLEMLTTVQGVRLIITSRSRLNILGEQLYPLVGLKNSEVKDVDNILTKKSSLSASLQLFEQIARRGQPSFQLNEENLVTVMEICRLVEGMPLAIELSAAWSALLKPVEILSGLQNNLDFLETESMDVPERQRSMRAVFHTSWRLIREQERTAVRRLAIFQGGFTLEAAEQASEISIKTLHSLLNNCWIERDSNGRFQMHELTRQYALEKLERSGEKEWMHARHLNYYRELAERSYAPIWGGPQQLDWLLQLDQETGNMEAAIKWGCQQRQVEAVEQTLHLIGGLYSYLWYRGRIVEGLLWAESALDVARALPVHSAALGKVLLVAGTFAFFHTSMERAETYIEAGLAANRAAEDLGGISHALFLSGLIAANRNKIVRAESLFQEGLQIARKIESGWLIEYLLQNLAELAWANGNIQQAYDLYSDALKVSMKLGDHLGRFNVLIGLGRLSLQLGKLSDATIYSGESLALSQELDSPRDSARARRLKAALAFEEGKNEEASALTVESLSISWKIGDYRHALFTLEDLAFRVSKQGQSDQAVRLFAACQAAYLHFGLQRSTGMEKEVTHLLEGLQYELGSSSFYRAWEEGQQLSWEQALRLAGGKI